MNTIKITLPNGTIVEYPSSDSLTVTYGGTKMEFCTNQVETPEKVKDVWAFLPSYTSPTGMRCLIPCIKAVRTLSLLGLGDAKRIVENASVFRLLADATTTNELVEMLERQGTPLSFY